MTEDGNKPRRKGKGKPPTTDQIENDRARALTETDKHGHLTGSAVLHRLYQIRDASLDAWRQAIEDNDAKGVHAQSTSFERVAGAIKQQENINAIRGVGTEQAAPLIAGLDPARILAAIPQPEDVN